MRSIKRILRLPRHPRRTLTVSPKDRRLQPNAKTMKRFLAQLVRGTTTGRLELAWGNEKGIAKARLYARGQIDDLVRKACTLNRQGFNVYVGACLRKNAGHKGQPSNKESIEQAVALWVDLDKSKGVLDRARSELVHLGVEPNVETITGKRPFKRGHLWILFDKPTDDFDLVERLNKALRDRFGGDNVQNVNRLMRIPGSIAHPIKKGRLRELTSAVFLSDKRYSIEKLKRALLGSAAKPAKSAAGHSKRSMIPPGGDTEAGLKALQVEVERVRAAPEGRRNDTLNRAAFAAGQYIAAGHLTRATAEAALRGAGIEKELKRGEVEATLKSGLNKGMQRPREPNAARMPSGFSLRDDGLYHIEGETERKVSDRVEITALARDKASGNWSRVIEFNDMDGKEQVYMASRAIKTEELRQSLLARGLRLGNGKDDHNHVIDFIARSEPTARYTIAYVTGWTGQDRSSFVLADGRVIGSKAIILQPPDSISPIADATGAKGTLKAWREEVAALCVGNDLLVFATSLAFAGPLLDVVGLESGGFHVRGGSSTGKTALERPGASAWGSPRLVQPWNATSNAMEGIAQSSNCMTVFLDDIGLVSPDEVGTIVYMLANERPKGRANNFGTALPRSGWRILFISTGEVSLAGKMLEGKKRPKAGQEVRFLDIPIEGHPFGVFDDLHGREGGAEFEAALKSACERHYGTAGPRFIEHLIRKPKKSARLVREFIREIRNSAQFDPGRSGQVDRALARFALVGAAGELATLYGITGWPAGAALQAAKHAFETWLTARGGAEAAELHAAVTAVRDYLSKYATTRFEVVSKRAAGLSRPLQQRDGWIYKENYYFTREAWGRVHDGADFNQAARLLRDKKLLISEKDGKHLTRKLHQFKAWCFCVVGTILNED